LGEGGSEWSELGDDPVGVDSSKLTVFMGSKLYNSSPIAPFSHGDPCGERGTLLKKLIFMSKFKGLNLIPRGLCRR